MNESLKNKYIRSFQKFFRLVFALTNGIGESKKCEILHEGSLACQEHSVMLVFEVSGIFMEFWGIDWDRLEFYEFLVERALKKIDVKSLKGPHGL